MGLDCIITYPGDNVGRHGHPKKDRTGPVREFVVNNQLFYTAVFNHIKNCGKCNPAEAVQLYFKSRFDEDGQELGTTDILCKLISRYKKRFPDKISDEVVKNFYYRLSHREAFAEYLETRDGEEIPEILKIQIQIISSLIRKSIKMHMEGKQYFGTWHHSCIELGSHDNHKMIEFLAKHVGISQKFRQADTIDLAIEILESLNRVTETDDTELLNLAKTFIMVKS